MRIAKHRIIASLVLAITAGYAAAPVRADQPSTSPASAADPALQSALAERFCDLALNSLHNRVIIKPMLQLSEALLQEAMQLNPDEPRYPRLLTEAAMQMKDYDTALAALKAYTHLVPRDEVATLQRVALQLQKMETADARLAYLQQLVDASQVSPTLRARFALQAADIYAERGQDPQARELLMQSIRLDPLYQDARKTWLRWLGDAGNSYDQLGQLLAMLLANPAQADVLQALAAQTAAAGMAPESLSFYNLAFSIVQRSGGAVNRDLVIGYAAELLISGDRQKALTLCMELLRNDNADFDALQLAVLIVRGADQQNADTKAGLDKFRLQLQNVLLNRLTVARQKPIEPGATTRPVDSDEPISLPDFVSDQRALKDHGTAADQQAYASALGDLVWFELYYNADPDDARKMLDALQQMEPENSVAVARLTGWYLLLTHDDAKAREKFTAISDRDPLAQLGLIRLEAADPTSKIRAVDDADKVLSSYPAGMLGATLFDGTGGLGAHGTALPIAQQIRADLAKFPQDWLQIIEQPQRFYIVRGEPLRLSHEFSEPMIATVTIENIGTYPLTIGKDGVIRPDLWIDAQTRGFVQQSIPGAAVTQLAGPLVLNPRESTSVQMRIDQGALGQMLNANPQVAFEIFAKVKTNVTNGGQATGPCGYAADFSQLFVRSENPSGDLLQKMNTTLTDGKPVDKLNTVDLGLAYFQAIAQNKPSQAGMDYATQIFTTLHDGLRDPNAAVTIWTTFRMMPMFAPAAREDQVDKMLLSTEPMERLLGILSAQALGQTQGWDKWVSESKKLADDPDPIVKLAATATAGIAQALLGSAPAATQPTTESTTQPESDLTSPAAAAPATVPAEAVPTTGPTDMGTPAVPTTAPAAAGDIPTTQNDVPATLPAATQSAPLPATSPSP